MMYCEFIKRTGFGESYMTPKDYHDFIEPVYMESDETKDDFCARFYELHTKYVCPAVDMMIKSLGTDLLMEYISGDSSVMSDVESVHYAIKDAFLRTWNKLE